MGSSHPFDHKVTHNSGWTWADLATLIALLLFFVGGTAIAIWCQCYKDQHQEQEDDEEDDTPSEIVIGASSSAPMQGLTKEQIQLLPKTCYPPATMHHDTECSFCIEEFENGEDLFQLRCGHIFHPYCISLWLLATALCPNCRGVVTLNPRYSVEGAEGLSGGVACRNGEIQLTSMTSGRMSDLALEGE